MYMCIYVYNYIYVYVYVRVYGCVYEYVCMDMCNIYLFILIMLWLVQCFGVAASKQTIQYVQ